MPRPLRTRRPRGGRSKCWRTIFRSISNGGPIRLVLDAKVAEAKQKLLESIKRSVYVYRVDCGGCNGCEIEIFATITAVFDAERFGIKVVPSPRHADMLIYTGAMTRSMREPALRPTMRPPIRRL